MSEWLDKNWLALLALVVAIASATFGGINAYLNWRGRRRKLRVTLDFGHTMFSAGGSPLSRELLRVNVTNLGTATELANCWLETRGGDHIRGKHRDSFEARTLDHQETETLSFLPTRIADNLRSMGRSGTVRIRAVVVDKIGVRVRSGLVRFDVDKWVSEYDLELQNLTEQMKKLTERIDPNDPNELRRLRRHFKP